MGRAVPGQLLLVVGAGEDPGDDPGAGAYAAEHVVRGVARHHGPADVGHGPGAQEGGQHHVREGPAPAARVGGTEGERDEVLPAEGGEDGVLGGAGEAGGQDDGTAFGGEAFHGLAGAGERGDAAAVDEFAVRLLEGGVGVLRPLLVTEEVPEDGDLGLAHGVAYVGELTGVLVGSGPYAETLGGGGEGLLDEAAVGDGGAGHVEDDEVVGVTRDVGREGRIGRGRHVVHQPSWSAVVSAMAGEHVMPRPPGPVTSQTPSRTCCRWTTRAVSVHWA